MLRIGVMVCNIWDQACFCYDYPSVRFLKYFIQLFFLLVGIQNLGLSFLCNSRHFNYISNQIKSVEEGQGEMLEERLRVEGRMW